MSHRFGILFKLVCGMFTITVSIQNAVAKRNTLTRVFRGFNIDSFIAVDKPDAQPNSGGNDLGNCY